MSTRTEATSPTTPTGSQRRKLGLFGEVLASGVLVGMTAVVNLLSVVVLARTLDPIAFGLFATCRRVVAFAAPLASLGGHLGVSRYLGYYASEASRRVAVLQIGLALTLIVASTTAVAFAVLYQCGDRIEWVAALANSVWFATAALTMTTAAGLVTFSILRGLGHSRLANLHQLMVLAAILVAAIAWRDAKVEQLLLAAAGAGASINAGCLIWVLRRYRHAWSWPRWSNLRAIASQVLGYSIVRIADGPLQASLSLIGVIAAPAIGGLALAGYIHISQTVVRITEIVVVPLSVVFLPVVAKYVREGRARELHVQAQLVYEAIVMVGACAAAHGIAWGQPVLDAAFGTRYAGALPYLLWSLPSILPFLLFAAFRSFIDGYSKRPVNTVHLLVANAFILVATRLCGGLFDGLGLCVTYTCGVTLLGALTLRFARRAFGLRLLGRATMVSLALACGGGAIGWGVAHELRGLGSPIVFGVGGCIEAVLIGLTVWAARRCKHPVPLFVVQRLQALRRGRRTDSGRESNAMESPERPAGSVAAGTPTAAGPDAVGATSAPADSVRG